ncbi:hypothetical protein PV328_006438 [Microctonus aethiopoides]|uniref:RRM domain-containing protein n=1 Tax=Microctonus aethiopoides TaxID=144406 RepID=A0AA39FPD8_9HYME|nr:hypothetical protein PV328_006438 [Microctonus aethiopoides]
MSARLLKDPSTANCRIFVGHLQTDETNKVELEQHFSKYGAVIGSLINRGFGFVQFENEQSAQAAIKQEDGQVFKGRRIDVRPAKKDTHTHGDSGDKSKQQSNQSFGQKNTSFTQRNNSFGGGSNTSGGGGTGVGGGTGNTGNVGNNASGNSNFNSQKQNFGSGNQNNNSDTSFDDKSTSINPQPASSKEQFHSDTNKSQDEEKFQQFDNSKNDSMNKVNQNRDNADQNDQFNSGNDNQNRGSGNNQFSGTNQNRGDDCGNSVSSGGSGGNQGGNSGPNSGPQNNQNRVGNNSGNQNRSGNNTNRNQNNQSGNHNTNQGQGGGNGGGGGGGGGGGSQSRPRGNRGGKNKNKNRNDNSGGGNNFRDRSPLNRGPRGGNDNKGGGLRDWDHSMMPRNNNFGRDSFNDNGRFDDRFKDPPMGGMNFDRANDYPLPLPDKNDCEIIVVNKSLTEYAEAIEARLKKMNLTVDLLFPNEEVPLSRVLGNIANRGCLYAVVVTQNNMEHHSMTLNILHGLPQEHRNMPVEDALGLINRDFSNYKSGGRAVPFNTPFANDRHPDAIQVLLNMLADNHQLTVLQFDRVLKYLEIKREEQVQTELGDTKDLGPTTITVNDPKQAELQSRILNILNSNKPSANSVSLPSPVPAPNPVPPAVWASAVTTTTSSSSTTVTPSPLLNDPTVQKALDSLLQGNLLKSIGDSAQTGPSSTAPQPLFAAFPNIDRF